MPVVNSALRGVKIAILASNGFNEADMTQSQKALLDAGAHVRVISTENGLVCGWTGTGWGHHYAIDCNIRTALGADYDALIVPGGQRSIDKLRLTAHTKRFISSFMGARKPVVTLGDAVQILPSSMEIAGRTVTGPVEMRADIEQAGAFWGETEEQGYHIDDNLVSGLTATDACREKMIDVMINFIATYNADEQADKPAQAA